MSPTRTDEEVFDSKIPVDDRDPTQCWLWTGYIDPKGYGRFRDKGSAHRASYRLFVGPIPDGMTVDHLCFVPRCVNPHHLRLLTHSENSANSRRAKSATCIYGHSYLPDNLFVYKDGRRDCRICMRRRGAEAKARALARNPRERRAKLDNQKARAARERYAAGETLTAIACEFGVAVPTLSNVVTGKSWKDAGGPLLQRWAT